MITIEQINGEIAVLEQEKPTHVIMQKLAALYVVRDHIVISDTPVKVTTETIPKFEIESDFVSVLEGKDIRSVVPVFNELVEAVQITNPRLYEGFMRNLRQK